MTNSTHTTALTALCLGLPAWAGTRRNVHSLTPILIIRHPSSTSSILGSLSFTIMPHIHLTILISARWSATSLSFLIGRVSLWCNILLCTQLLYNLRIIKDKSNVLFYLLPAKRDVQLTTRLRCARQYPTIYARTNRYKNSFILFGLNHFQWCDFVYIV